MRGRRTDGSQGELPHLVARPLIGHLRVALTFLGVLAVLAGVAFLRLFQHELHVAREAAGVEAAEAHVGRVRAVSRRFYDALGETTAAADRLAKAEVLSVRQQLDGFRDAASAMSAARRDTAEAAAAFRAETGADVGEDARRVAHADDALIESFVEAHRLIVTVLARPRTERQFSGAGKQLQSAMRDAIAEFRGAREALVGRMRDALAASRASAAEAGRGYERVRAATLADALLEP